MEFIDIIDIKLRNFIIYGPTLLRTREALGVQKIKFNQLAGLSTQMKVVGVMVCVVFICQYCGKIINGMITC